MSSQVAYQVGHLPYRQGHRLLVGAGRRAYLYNPSGTSPGARLAVAVVRAMPPLPLPGPTLGARQLGDQANSSPGSAASYRGSAPSVMMPGWGWFRRAPSRPADALPPATATQLSLSAETHPCTRSAPIEGELLPLWSWM
jgi:hypothetical protein